MATTPTFKPAQRSHTSVLAAAEKRALIHVAEHLPAWVNSDHLTGLGFVSLLLAGGAYWYGSREPRALLLVVVFLALNWFGDSLDGTLARVRNRQRPRYGFYVDHILDALGMTALMSGLALSGFISHGVAAVFLIVYLLLSVEVFLTTYTIGTFHLSHWSFGPTELRILLCIGNIVVQWRPRVVLFGNQYLLFDVGFAVGTVGLVLILLQATVQHTIQLYREETKD
jgi:archaetidylinositol phosphate synthase